MDEIIEQKKYDPKWEEWSEKGDLRPLGYRIVKGKSGHRLDQLSIREYFITSGVHGTLYHHSLGKLSKFYRGLFEKKLYGTRCPKCGFVYMPPRANCWGHKCRLCETEWIELPLTGILHTYSILGFSATPFLSMLPFILIFVRIDGTNTAMAGRLVNVDPLEVRCDMRVKANFVDEPKGNPMDLFFTPLEDTKSNKRAQHDERLREQLKVIEDWVQKKFGKLE